MPDLIRALREEIARIARREARDAGDQTQAALNQARQELAELKKELTQLRQRLALLEAQERARLESANGNHVDQPRFSPASLKAHRAKLSLSAADYGKLVGVSSQSVYLWERGQTRPRQPQLSALAELRQLTPSQIRQRLAMLNGD